MGDRPIIGITPGFIRNQNKLAIGQGYVDGVNNAGGLSVILPLCSDEDMVEEILELTDGLLFSGGSDIDARHFGEENLKCGGEIIPERDCFELMLAKRAMERKIPVFGICRGIQLINIVLGGTIYQDIYTCRQTEYDRVQGSSSGSRHAPAVSTLKHWQEAPGWYPVHDVKIKTDSMLYRILGADTIGANSYHHQAINTAGNGISVVAASSDGVAEAIEGSGNQFILAVQWHPERMLQENPSHLKLFKAFVQAARTFRTHPRVSQDTVPPMCYNKCC